MENGEKVVFVVPVCFVVSVYCFAHGHNRYKFSLQTHNEIPSPRRPVFGPRIHSRPGHHRAKRGYLPCRGVATPTQYQRLAVMRGSIPWHVVGPTPKPAVPPRGICVAPPLARCAW